MAAFCKQCSLDLFGFDYGDLEGITKQDDWDQGYANVVLCEDCGTIQVDPEGGCVTKNCLKGGHK